MWERLWQKPQALLWLRDGVTDQVAMYVRTFIESAKVGASVQRRTLLRQQADALLLTIPSLHAARVQITETTPEPTSEDRAKSRARHPSSRALLRVVEPDRANED